MDVRLGNFSGCQKEIFCIYLLIVNVCVCLFTGERHSFNVYYVSTINIFLKYCNENNVVF